MLIDEMEVASRILPGLVEVLSGRSLMELEEGDGRWLADLFREHGKPAFLVPRGLGGDGGSLREAAQVLRWVGARAPSLAIMMTMHHHSVAGFSRGGVLMPARRRWLERLSEDRALVASAFSEGRPGAEILDSSVECTKLQDRDGFRIAGVKKPCCMAHHADFLVVGVSVNLSGGGKSHGLAVVERALGGIRNELCWPGEVLVASDSHGVTFDGVVVPADYVLAPGEDGTTSNRERLAVSHAEIALSCLFQLMVSASYLGMASRLCEMVLKRRAGTADQRVRILSRLETAVMAAYQLADMLEAGDFSAHLLARSMLVGQNAGAQIDRAVAEGAKALGGSGYLASREAQYLLLSSRCIYFHPPSDRTLREVVEACYTELA